jgi:hypothetical protein
MLFCTGLKTLDRNYEYTSSATGRFLGGAGGNSIFPNITCGGCSNPKFVGKDYHPDKAWLAIDTAKCNSYGVCEVACPTKDIKAIRVWKNAG